jgi:hypothetical protein
MHELPRWTDFGTLPWDLDERDTTAIRHEQRVAVIVLEVADAHTVRRPGGSGGAFWKERSRRATQQIGQTLNIRLADSGSVKAVTILAVDTPLMRVRPRWV